MTGYLKKRIAGIEALMKKPPGNFSVQDFHRLRLETKKLMAVVSMLHHSDRAHKMKKKLKPLRKIFDQAGKARALQLEVSLLQKYVSGQMLKTYQGILQNKLLKEKRKFSIVQLKEKDKLKNVFDFIISVAMKTRNKNAMEYLDHKKLEIYSFIKPEKLKTSKLHKLRKVLKTFSYTQKSLDLKNKGITYKAINELQVILGKWHDYRVLIGHLSAVAGKSDIPTPERKRIMKITGQLDSKSQMLLKKITAARKKTTF